MKNRFCFLFSGALGLGLFSCSNSTGPTGPDSAAVAAFDALSVQTTVVDGRTYSYRSGGSGPEVMFEAGLGSDKDVWVQVLPEVARFSGVFAYDRAGYSGSDPGPQPRDGARMVDELRQVLQSTGRRPPYVLVGHSLGGTLMELYARTRPSEPGSGACERARSGPISPLPCRSTAPPRGHYPFWRGSSCGEFRHPANVSTDGTQTRHDRGGAHGFPAVRLRRADPRLGDRCLAS